MIVVTGGAGFLGRHVVDGLRERSPDRRLTVLDRRPPDDPGAGAIQTVVGGVLGAARRGRAGERYVLSGENVTFREIAEVVCRVAGERRWVFTVPDPVRDLLGWVRDSLLGSGDATFHPHLHDRWAHPFYSSGKARRELGYDPRGFDDVVADYLRYRRERSGRDSGVGTEADEEER